MADLFAPTFRDGKSGARLVADFAAGKPTGTVLTYEDLAEHLGVDPADMSRIFGAVTRAKRVLLREHKRALVAVPGQGYKILHPNENAGLAVHHRRKSDRQIRKAIAVIKGTDEAKLTDVERARHHHVGMVLQNLHERQLDVEGRVSRLESLMLGGSRPKVIPGELVADAKALEAALPADEDAEKAS